MTAQSEHVGVQECTNLHPMRAGSAFCHSCGQPRATAKSAPVAEGGQVNSAPSMFGTRFPTGPPWLLGQPSLGAFGLSGMALVLMVGISMLAFYIGGPRPLWYFVLVAGLVMLVCRALRLGPWEILGLTVATAAEVVLSTTLIFPAMRGVLGQSDQMIWPDPWSVSASFGRMSLAVGLAALWSPQLRSQVGAFLHPRPPAFDVLRSGVVALVACLTLVAVLTTFPDWGTFAASQSGSPGQEQFQQQPSIEQQQQFEMDQQTQQQDFLRQQQRQQQQDARTQRFFEEQQRQRQQYQNDYNCQVGEMFCN